MTTMDSDPADLLHVFLSTAEDAEHTITVVTGPAVYLPQLAPQAAGASRASTASPVRS